MDNNQTNIEKADDLAGKLGNLGVIPGPQAPYIGFLASTPAAITGLGILLDKIHDGTADEHDYEHALNALGGVS